MSEFRGTPGPWILDDALHGDLVEDRYHFIDAGEGFCGEDELGFGLSGCMSKADARLIAVSPEMFELIEMVHSSFGGGNIITFSDNDIARFAEVFAKATGADHD